MSHLLKYSNCPVCNNHQLKEVFVVKDYSVSGESFLVSECSNCRLRFTQQVPCETAIQRYYQSSDYVSHSDTKKGLINKLYHLARRFTLSQKLNLVRTVTGKKTGMHLDVGSGTGSFVNTMAKAGWNSIGLEPDSKARIKAVELYNVDIFPSDEFTMLPESTYDVITLWHVLEHVHSLNETVGHLRKLLAPGGKLILAVPNYKSKDAQHYNEYWAAYDVPRHLYHFVPSAMKLLMQNHGMQVIDIKPMWFDSFYVSMLSEKYKKGNLVKAFWNGFVSNCKTLFSKEQGSSLIYIVEALKTAGAEEIRKQHLNHSSPTPSGTLSSTLSIR